MSLIPSAAAQIMVRNVVKITRNVLKKISCSFQIMATVACFRVIFALSPCFILIYLF